MTAATVSVGTPTLINGSTLSTRVVVGGKTLNSVATYNVVSTNGSATINDLSFTVSGSQSGTVESLTINGVTANVIGGVANFYGINLAVTSLIVNDSTVPDCDPDTVNERSLIVAEPFVETTLYVATEFSVLPPTTTLVDSVEPFISVGVPTDTVAAVIVGAVADTVFVTDEVFPL
jgi:hypothetical protein